MMTATHWRLGRRPRVATPSGAPDLDLEDIERHMVRLFDLVAGGLAKATSAFLAGDRRMAADLVADDPAIDTLQLDVEDLAQRRLVERVGLRDADVRLLVAVLRIVPELERSADLVEHIALRTGVLVDVLPEDVRALIAEMGGIAVSMWRDAGQAWTRRDAGAAEELRVRDDAIDDLHVRLTARLSNIRLTNSEAIELGLVARFFERLGDHAVNVTRRLAFLQAPDPTVASAS